LGIGFYSEGLFPDRIAAWLVPIEWIVAKHFFWWLCSLRDWVVVCRSLHGWVGCALHEALRKVLGGGAPVAMACEGALYVHRLCGNENFFFFAPCGSA